MKKRKTLKWLVIFVAVLLASMFFSRTVQTITTPKIQKIAATRGRLEEKIPVSPVLAFSAGEEFFMKEAKKLNMAITEVLAQQGFFVKKGDVLARAELPSYEEELGKLQGEYDKSVRELGEHYLSQVRLAKDSPHNQLYEQYFLEMQAYYKLKVKAELQAAAQQYILPDDMRAWGVQPEPAATPRPQARPTESPVPLADMPESMKGIMQQVFDAWYASEQTFAELRRVYTGNSKITRTPEATFDYIKKIYGFERAVAEHSADILALEQLAGRLKEVRAPHDGYLTVFTLKAGDSYDGAKSLFTISKEGELPSLKADITDIKKQIAVGTKVTIDGLRQDLAVSSIMQEGLNKKFIVVDLTESLISQLGGIGKLLSAPPELTLTYKAERTTTLLPASAVRTDADGSSYIYTIQQSWGGMLGNLQYKLAKQPVTVLESSGRMVAISEDISYMDIADREDRAVTDGQIVMEYVD